MCALLSALKKSVARLRHSDTGSTAAEFAIAVTVAVGLIFAVVDVARAFIVGGLLSDAARQVSRQNQVKEDPHSSAAFTAAANVIIEARSAGMLDPQQVAISTTVYDSFEDLANNSPESGGPPGGNPDQIVKYRFTYDMDYYTPFIGLFMDGAEFNHVVEIIVYNEPDVES
jgi:hypothetical protein